MLQLNGTIPGDLDLTTLVSECSDARLADLAIDDVVIESDVFSFVVVDRDRNSHLVTNNHIGWQSELAINWYGGFDQFAHKAVSTLVTEQVDLDVELGDSFVQGEPRHLNCQLVALSLELGGSDESYSLSEIDPNRLSLVERLTTAMQVVSKVLGLH